SHRQCNRFCFHVSPDGEANLRTDSARAILVVRDAFSNAILCKHRFAFPVDGIFTCQAYSTPNDASDSSNDGKSICSFRPCACISSSSSKARNRRILTAAYCSESERVRPWDSAQAATTWCGRKT